MYGPSVLSGHTREALDLLAKRVRLGRKERGWTVAELAERLGVSPVTLRKVERGDPTVALGTAFEAAALVGVALFDPDPGRRVLEGQMVEARLAVLPATTRPASVEDDF